MKFVLFSFIEFVIIMPSESELIDYEFDEEFQLRVKHNFKLYVLLSSKNIWNEDDILNSIYKLAGYRCHKTVKYCEFSSHIHVKFEEEHHAMEAVDFFNKKSDLTAVLVDGMLRDWFSYEMRAGFGPPCTLTIVDVVGYPPFALNFLTTHLLNYIFRDFGTPYVMPYTAAISEPHVQVLFNSMTEALAASMAFGVWREKGDNIDSFSYRVRINPSNKEALLIRKSGGNPFGAFKLDYFISMRNEVLERSLPAIKNGLCHQHTKGKRKSEKKLRNKDKYPQVHTSEPQSLTNQIRYRAPILCVPIIAPLNSDVVSEQLGKDLMTVILNLQKPCCSTYSMSSESSKERENAIASADSRPKQDEARNLCEDHTQSSKSTEGTGGKNVVEPVVTPEQVFQRSLSSSSNSIPGPTTRSRYGPRAITIPHKQKSRIFGRSR